jgi:hypothetical protein
MRKSKQFDPIVSGLISGQWLDQKHCKQVYRKATRAIRERTLGAVRLDLSEAADFGISGLEESTVLHAAVQIDQGYRMLHGSNRKGRRLGLQLLERLALSAPNVAGPLLRSEGSPEHTQTLQEVSQNQCRVLAKRAETVLRTLNKTLS